MTQTPAAQADAQSEKPQAKQSKAKGTGVRTYVLDTSVLLSAPNAIHQFAEHEVVIPLVVVTELEAKRVHPLLGFQAREVLRSLDALRSRGDIRHGVVINDQGGTVRIEINHVDTSGLPDAVIKVASNDTRILAVAANLAKDGRDVTVVSKDMPMRILADALDLGAEEYRNEMVVVDKAYTGLVEIDVDQAVVDALYSGKSAPSTVEEDLMEGLDSLAALAADDAVLDIDGGLVDSDGAAIPVNTAVRLLGYRSTGLAVVTPDKTLRKVHEKREIFGVQPRSVEQTVAMDHLMNPEVGIVSLGGGAGTGKTYTALAAGLEQVVEQRRYKKVMVFRPLFAVGGQELGYLPGSADEKMSPWGAAVFDALGSMTSKDAVEEILRQEMLEVLPLTHLRGRSLNDVFVILDEAQNLEKPVLLTALSRLGENSKVVLSWDAAQRDNTRVGRHDGIAAIVERLKGEPLFAHTTFTKSERGPIAALVTRVLDDMVV